jgi:hypothetical protein
MLTLILLMMIRDEQGFKMVHSGKKRIIVLTEVTSEMMLSLVNILSAPSSFMQTLYKIGTKGRE